VPKLLIGELKLTKPSALGEQDPVPEKKVSNIGVGPAGSLIPTESMLVHPIEPNVPVGTIFVVTKLVMLVVVVIMLGTANDQLYPSPGSLKLYTASPFASAAEAR